MSSNTFAITGGFTSIDFCKTLLSSPEFTVQTLKSLGKYSGTKEEIALKVASDLQYGTLSWVTLWRAFVKQPRKWITIKIGKPSELLTLGNIQELHNDFGCDGWHGPFLSSEGKTCYIGTFSATTYELIDGEPIEFKIRWHAVAEIGNDYLCVGWNGFSVTEIEKPDSSTQFQCWKWIRDALLELENLIGGSWTFPNLHKLVLVDALEYYSEHNHYKWEHMRVRAESSGIALSAKSSASTAGGTIEFKVQGLEKLANSLAKSCMSIVNPDYFPADLEAVSKRLLMTIIRELGTKSYEFRLAQEGSQKRTYLVRAHVYFGLEANENSEDSFLHINCFLNQGGDNTLKFILEHLEMGG